MRVIAGTCTFLCGPTTSRTNQDSVHACPTCRRTQADQDSEGARLRFRTGTLGAPMDFWGFRRSLLGGEKVSGREGEYFRAIVTGRRAKYSFWSVRFGASLTVTFAAGTQVKATALDGLVVVEGAFH